MSLSEQKTIVEHCRRNWEDAVALIQASLAKLQPYNPDHVRTPDDREPYDALSDRFIRAVETALKFFRSYERLQFAEESDTLRDRLNRMEKLELISSVELWFEMREVRNRIVHDYLPNEVKQIYADLMGPFSKELIDCSARAQNLAL